MATSEQIKNRFFEIIHENKMDKKDLFEIWEHLTCVLSIQTIPQKAKELGKSYQAIDKRKGLNKFNRFGLKLIWDED